MKRPGLFVRVAGTAPMAMLLCFVYGLLLLGWLQGYVAWWLAIVAAVAALRTLAASGELRRYRAWEAEWNAMGEAGTPSKAVSQVTTKRRPWPFLLAALLLVVIIPNLPRECEPFAVPLAFVWVAALGCLVFAFFRSIVSRVQKRAAAKVETAKPVNDDAVAWLLPPASVSPSRDEAQSNLPAYCLRLIEGNVMPPGSAAT